MSDSRSSAIYLWFCLISFYSKDIKNAKIQQSGKFSSVSVFVLKKSYYTMLKFLCFKQIVKKRNDRQALITYIFF